jgi:hypothetical protein
MQRFGEIWYFERSLAAPLARPLSRRYALRALAQPTRDQRAALPIPGQAGIVCLADLAGKDLSVLRRLARRNPKIRLIGITRNATDNGHSAGCFAMVPSKANSKLVSKVVAAAFDNIELAQRERHARAELKRTELEMEELNRIGVALSETRDVGVLLDLNLCFRCAKIPWRVAPRFAEKSSILPTLTVSREDAPIASTRNMIRKPVTALAPC